MRKHAFFGFLGLMLAISCIPAVNGAEQNVLLSPFTHSGFHVSLTEGFNLNWEFETHDDSFQATIRIDDTDGYYIYLATAEVQGSGVYVIPKEDTYYITLWNNDPGVITGYIRFTYNDPPISIPGYIPVMLMGIIAITVFIEIKNVEKRR